MMKDTFLENGWKMSDEDMMWYAAKAGLTYKEYTAYKETLKNQAKEAMRDLKGMFVGADALYEDTIINSVGEKFLVLFRRFEMIESCGVIGGRKVYAI